jgi:regulator of sigma E protease
MSDFSFDGFGSVLVFIVVLSVLVFVHELGHFLVSRLFKVHVEEFGLGFPPRVLGVVRDRDNRWRFFFGQAVPSPADLGGRRTIYSLNALPIGGFIRPAGEDNPAVPDGLAAASKTARISILSAGAGFNLIFALLVFTVGFRLGWPDRVTVDQVVAGSPADSAGLRPGDTILRADGDEIHYTQQIRELVYAHLGAPLEIVVERDGQALTFDVTPRTQWPADEGPMGIAMGRAMVTDYTWPEALGRAAREIAFQFEGLLHLPGRLVSGEMPLDAARPIGIVGMNDLTRVAVTTAQEINEWFPVLQLVGLISVALAMTNLLPLPALDGGRILFVLIEAVRGRRVDPAREGFVHMVGMLMLLALYLFSDLGRDDLAALEAAWPEAPVERRRSIMHDLGEIAEANFEVLFDPVFRLGLEDEDAEVRATAVANLWESEAPELIAPLLDLMLHDPALAVRTAAASALGRFVYLGEVEELPAAQARRVEDALLGVIGGDDDLEVRRRALEAVSFSGRPEVGDLIEQAYASPDRPYRVSAVFAMGRSADPRWSERVLAELDSADPELRYEAARAAGELELQDAVPALQRLLEEGEVQVREAAIWSLGQVGGDQARESLLDLLQDAEDDERDFIEDALENLTFHDDLLEFPLIDLDDDDLDDEPPPPDERLN